MKPIQIGLIQNQSISLTRIFFLLIALLLSNFLRSQNIAVSLFRSLPQDMDARINFSKKDLNGDVCAIIKVVTTQTGFSFDSGQIGIVTTVQKPAEIWLYVPYGTKRLTISHPQLGILRDYIIPKPVEKATVYELVLETGKVTTSVIPVAPIWLTFRSTPEDADVYVNEVLKGNTPVALKLLPGKYTYRIEKALYHPSAGFVEIYGQEKDGKKDLPVILKPAFGSIKINTDPEQGAFVFVDDLETGKTTPFSATMMKSGIHKITVKKEFYQPKSFEITVKDGEMIEKTIAMASNAAYVIVSAQSNSNIYIDGTFADKGFYKGRVPAGVTTFEAKLDGYYPDKKDKDLAVGDTVTINLSPQPIVGNVDIVTNPLDATVILNGEKRGTTPITLKDLKIGRYELKLEKAGYNEAVTELVILENKTIEVNERLIANKAKTRQTVQEEQKKETINQQHMGLSEKPEYPAIYYKYKKSKTIWFVSALVSGGAGIYSYLQAEQSYSKIQTATTDATELQQKVKLYDMISPIAFGVAGLCTLEFILKSGKQKKAKGQKLSFYLKPNNFGGGVGLAYNF